MTRLENVKKEEEYIAINCQKEDGNDYIECSLIYDDMLVETSYLIYYEIYHKHTYLQIMKVYGL